MLLIDYLRTPYHYRYDELLRVPFLIRRPDDTCSRVQRPFSLAWLHELIGEGVDSFESELPACGWNSETEDTGSQGYVIADSLTEHGHTSAVRDGDNKYLRHFGEELYREMLSLEPIVSDYLKGVGYKIENDRKERVPLAGRERSKSSQTLRIRCSRM